MSAALHTIYIGVGSNQESARGTPEETVRGAEGELRQKFAAILKKSRASSIYLTEPQLVKEQAWYANQVVELHLTGDVTPRAFLQALLELESSMGRVRSGGADSVRYGPRVIDLDLLLFDDVQCQSDSLTLPHPRMTERAFVLVPLAELAPDLPIPALHRTVRECLDGIEYRLDGRRIFQA